MVLATGVMIKQPVNRTDWPAYITEHYGTNDVLFWEWRGNVNMIQENIYEYHHYLKYIQTV